MDSDGLTILIPAGLLAIAFFVFLIMSRKSWKFFHIFCCFLLLVGYVFLLGLSAMAFKTRSAWSKIYNEQVAAEAKQAALRTRLSIGNPITQKETDWEIVMLKARAGRALERVAPYDQRNKHRALLADVYGKYADELKNSDGTESTADIESALRVRAGEKVGASANSWTEVMGLTLTSSVEVQAVADVLRVGDGITSVADVDAEYSRVMQGVGRVWRHCTIDSALKTTTKTVTTPAGTANVPSGEVVVRIRPAPAAGGDAGAQPADPSQHQILCTCAVCDKAEKTAAGSAERANRVFLFKELPFDYDGEKYVVPRIYLGEFTVKSATPDTITLTTSMPLNNLNYNPTALQDRTGTWAVYLRMPTDGHDILEGETRESVAGIFPLKTDTNDYFHPRNHYRRFANKMATFYAKLDALDIAPDVATTYPPDGVALDDASIKQQQDLLIDSFVHDVKNKNAIPESSALKNVDLPPENTWYRLKMLKARLGDEGFEVDSPDGWNQAARDLIFDPFDSTKTRNSRGKLFDDKGRAIIPSLRQGGKVELTRDNELLMDEYTWANLERVTGMPKSDVELVAEVHVRTLRDFAYLFRKADSEMYYVNQLVERLENECVLTNAALKSMKAKEAQYRDEYAKLEQDRDNFRAEQKEIARFEEKLKADIARSRTEIKQDYNDIIFYQSLLAELDRKVRAEIDRRAIAGGAEE